MAKINHLSFTFLDDGTVQTEFRREGFQFVGFDPVQLPELMKEVLGEVAVDQSFTIAQQNTALAAKDAELAAKDTNAQAMLEQIDALTTERDRLRVVVEAFPSELAPTPVEPIT